MYETVTKHLRKTLFILTILIFQQSLYSQKEIVGKVEFYKSVESDYRILESFPDVQFFRQENKGVASARNLGIKKASGDWIALLDSDDEWEPIKLEKQLAFLQKLPE